MTMPLDGVKMLDLSRLGPGPYGSMLLADMGAEVIMIEEAGRMTGRRAGMKVADSRRGTPPRRGGVRRRWTRWGATSGRCG